MRLNKIKTLCTRTATLRIFDEISAEGELRSQWICNGEAMWRLTGLPTIGTENIPALLGLSAKQVEQTRISSGDFPTAYDPGDYDSGDIVMQPAQISIKENGRENLILRGGHFVLTADAALLAPAWTEDTQILLRLDTNGKPYLVLMDGFFLSAIIMPTQNILTDADREALMALMRG